MRYCTLTGMISADNCTFLAIGIVRQGGTALLQTVALTTTILARLFIEPDAARRVHTITGSLVESRELAGISGKSFQLHVVTSPREPEGDGAALAFAVAPLTALSE